MLDAIALTLVLGAGICIGIGARAWIETRRIERVIRAARERQVARRQAEQAYWDGIAPDPMIERMRAQRRSNVPPQRNPTRPSANRTPSQQSPQDAPNASVATHAADDAPASRGGAYAGLGGAFAGAGASGDWGGSSDSSSGDSGSNSSD